jgi:cytochrome c oxidase cbb3-type subunit I/II
MLPGWILVLAGVSQPLEWAEFPLVVDAVVVVTLVLAAIQFLPGFFRRGIESLYVSSWYIIGGLVFTLLAYPMGNVVPEFVAGAAGAAFSGLWIHDAVGLFVTPLALAIIYFVIPASTGRPIYSHFLSMLGFWLLFFLYPLNGTHHYVFSVIPMAAQLSAIAASALLGVTVVIVVANLASVDARGRRAAARSGPAVRLDRRVLLSRRQPAGRLAGADGGEPGRPLHRLGGRATRIMAMLGFASFAGGGRASCMPGSACPEARYNARAIEWAFWLMVAIGLVVDGRGSHRLPGSFRGGSGQQAVPWMDSVEATRPYWLVRTLVGSFRWRAASWPS